jgi:hypothetical protein
MNIYVTILDAPAAWLNVRVHVQQTKDKLIRISQNLLDTGTCYVILRNVKAWRHANKQTKLTFQ